MSFSTCAPRDKNKDRTQNFKVKNPIEGFRTEHYQFNAGAVDTSASFMLHLYKTHCLFHLYPSCQLLVFLWCIRVLMVHPRTPLLLLSPPLPLEDGTLSFFDLRTVFPRRNKPKPEQDKPSSLAIQKNGTDLLEGPDLVGVLPES